MEPDSTNNGFTHLDKNVRLTNKGIVEEHRNSVLELRQRSYLDAGEDSNHGAAIASGLTTCS
jgi:hypothetical protein